MLKNYLTVVGLSVLLLSSAGYAQDLNIAAREATWNDYVLPSTPFVRRSNSSRSVMFRVPNEWQEQADLTFAGPHKTTLNVVVDVIPDGVPLRDYLTTLMKPLRDLRGRAESMLIRRTAMSGLEGREILFEFRDVRNDLSRRVIWCTVHGPTAVVLVLTMPPAHASEVEPYFKAVVQSVNVLEEMEYTRFETLRSTTIKDSKPVAINEVQKLTATLAGNDPSTRSTGIARLAQIFATTPDAALDLLVNRSPIIRGAVVQAIGRSRNQTLTPFLSNALSDSDLFVAERAAQAIASTTDSMSVLRKASMDWVDTQSMARVWPFLDKQVQIGILEEIFSRKYRGEPSARNPGRPNQRRQKEVTVTAVVAPPGSKSAPPAPIPQPAVDASRMLGGLTLLSSLSAGDLPLRLSQIIATGEDSIIGLALNLGLERKESLPPRELIKLLSSSSTTEVRRLAALNLARSAATTDIPFLENYSNTLSSRPGGTKVRDARAIRKSSISDEEVKEEVMLTIRKIHLRQQILTASEAERQQIIARELDDPKIKDWVWNEFVQSALDHSGKLNLTKIPDVSSLGEALFPINVDQYLTIPQPAGALERLGKSIGGLHLESARSQASFVLLLSVLREQIAAMFDAPPGAEVLDYTGVDLSAPISMATWSVANAPGGVTGAGRRAMVMRVKDRDRFERTLGLYQSQLGDFGALIDKLAVGTRMVTMFPALIPISARSILGPLDDEEMESLDVKSLRRLRAGPTLESTILTYSFSARTYLQGQPITVVEKVGVNSSGRLSRDALYCTYVGATAVLTPDLQSMFDVLARIANGDPGLAGNPEYQKAISAGGDAIYFSNLTAIFGEPGGENGKGAEKTEIKESGALNISNAAWENSYHISFGEDGWSRFLVPFKTETLLAPRELLPRTTVMYLLLNLDLTAGWDDLAATLFNSDKTKRLESMLALDFEKEVLPELSGECGAAIFGLPDFLRSDTQVSWAAFFRLKSDKLERALAEGRLFKEGPATKLGTVHIELDSGDFYATIKSGFLVLSTSNKGLAALDEKEKLAAAREFQRAVERAPDNMIAFGGYNLEAATAPIGDWLGDPLKAQQAALISSLAKAFHSTFSYARMGRAGVEARASVSMDREGRFSVAELSSLSRDYRPTYAVIEPRGVPIASQRNLSGLRVKLRTTASVELERIKEEITTPYQQVEKLSEHELSLKVLPRRSEPKVKLTLPITSPELQSFLQPTSEILSKDMNIIEKAREIVGTERDAWTVAKKLADWTHQNLKWKRVEYATASQTLATLEADCSEFSQLYLAMARSLGLPSRMVSGLAYSGSSFAGHAWVEVHIGEWVELDPTWGTTYADATHIRDSFGALLTYASLNLLEIEVLEAPRGIAEYQKSARLLAETVGGELSGGTDEALSTALDIAVLTDEYMGFGSWEGLNAAERDEMSSAYRRVLFELTGFKKEDGERPRLLKVVETDERAEALILQPSLNDLIIRLKLLKLKGAWQLAEVIQTETDLHIVSETLRPTINSIIGRRRGEIRAAESATDFVRALLVLNQDPKLALEILDQALQDNAGNRGLRHLKAMSHAAAEESDEAIQLWTELGNEDPPFSPALLSLANTLGDSEKEEDQQRALELYKRYVELETADPRAHNSMAELYETLGENEQAEIEYKKVIEIDAGSTDAFVELARFLSQQKHFAEAGAILDRAAGIAASDEDPFGWLMLKLYFREDLETAEEIVIKLKGRLEKSYEGNLYLGYLRHANNKYREAIPLFRKAATLNKDSSEPYDALAQSYRALRDWNGALIAANTAIRLAPEDGYSYYQRACVLARLGRSREALQSLEKAIELEPYLSESLSEEEDLKSLATHPRFKKLIQESDDQ